MSTLQLVVTDAGRAAMTDPDGPGFQAVTIAEMGVTDQAFIAAHTLTALPGEIKRISTLSGQPVDGQSINLVIRDDSEDLYVVTGFGLYLADGTLFAAHSAEDNATIVQKAGLASILLTIDVVFADVNAALIEFGDVTWTNPQATEEIKGVIEIATPAEVATGTDHTRAVTPETLHDTVRVRTVSGGGLATGGGDLTEDRVITVTEATEPQIAAGTDDSSVVTPRRLQGKVDQLIDDTLGGDADFAATIAAEFAALRAQIDDDRRGDVVFRATQTVPAGAFECDGRALSRADYAALFAVIGDSYGPGDGATTFNIPDMRGKFARGWDHGRGVDIGRAWASDQEDDNKSHTHTTNLAPVGGLSGSGSGSVASGDSVVPGLSLNRVSQAAGGSEARPKNVAGMFIIWWR